MSKFAAKILQGYPILIDNGICIDDYLLTILTNRGIAQQVIQEVQNILESNGLGLRKNVYSLCKFSGELISSGSLIKNLRREQLEEYNIDGTKLNKFYLVSGIIPDIWHDENIFLIKYNGPLLKQVNGDLSEYCSSLIFNEYITLEYTMSTIKDKNDAKVYCQTRNPLIETVLNWYGIKKDVLTIFNETNIIIHSGNLQDELKNLIEYYKLGGIK